MLPLTCTLTLLPQIGVEFRRYALRCNEIANFDDFYKKIEKIHQLNDIPFVIFYTDQENSLLPINNNENLAKAISSVSTHPVCTSTNKHSHSHHPTNHQHHQQQQHSYQHHSTTYQQQQQHTRPFLKLFIEKKGVFVDLSLYNGSLTNKKKHFRGLSNLISNADVSSRNRPSIGMPEDFRQVSSIIDVDVVPETCRRVRLVKHGSDKPLGFYIRDGTSIRVTSQGLEKVSGIFISRLVPGGLAESTGLLAVNDEVLEVNGIEVTHGKTLDQVTDMMVANSSNLIITIRPACQQQAYPYVVNNAQQFDTSTAGSASDDHDEDDEVINHLDKL
ncbi:Partitioning defective 6-like gamma, partial [Fragariocoptes setiger]